MFALTESHQFFLCNSPTDMRKSFNTLSAVVQNSMKRKPTSGEVFIFVNKRKNLMKILHWQSGGFVLYCKRLEIGNFEINFPGENTTENKISYTELAMIINGISVRNIQKRKRFSK